MNNIKRFIKTSFIYLSGNVLSKMVAFFLLPIYTIYISPIQYGDYDLILSIINLVSPIAFFQIWDGMFRYSFDYINDKEKYKVINNGVLLSILGIVIYAIIFNVVNIYFDFQYSNYAMLYGLVFAFQYLYTYSARIFLNNSLFVFSGVVNTLATAAINIVLIVICKYDIKALYLSPTIGCIIQIIIIECRLHLLKNFSIKSISVNLMKKMIDFSIPLCVATMSYWLLSGFTKIIINDMLGPYENGIYAVANRFASMITIFVTIFQYSWNEMTYLMAKDIDRISRYNICIDLMLKVIPTLSVVVCLLIKIIFPYFVAPQYSYALDIIPSVIVGVAMNSLASFLGTLFMTEKKTNYILISTLISSAINISLCYLFVKFMGLQGAVVSLMSSFILLMVLRIILLRRIVGITINYKNIFVILPMILGIVVFYKCDIKIAVLMILILFFILFLMNKKYLRLLLNIFKK